MLSDLRGQSHSKLSTQSFIQIIIFGFANDQKIIRFRSTIFRRLLWLTVSTIDWSWFEILPITSRNRKPGEVFKQQYNCETCSAVVQICLDIAKGKKKIQLGCILADDENITHADLEEFEDMNLDQDNNHNRNNSRRIERLLIFSIEEC
ncbi:hypothetical protein RF11_07270 [Thelohanellus kitauei]|uniref:Uncharacterized protein n=1 Tax=Thelohanellus kitauei TaxID=669202 RepID=A0A0C2JJV8_THEKT|nr:hypothetical protein RF11_07270 [Thelohanellus kitauei]